MDSFLSFPHSGKAVIAGLGISCIGVIYVVQVTLGYLRDEGEFKTVPPKPQYITQDTEDSLQPGTLDTLLLHYNYAIRETAAKIICDRSVNDNTVVDSLLWGITRPDYETRMTNLRSLAIIMDHQNLHQLHKRKAYTAIVRSLELCLDPDYPNLDDPEFDEFYLRDMAEKLLLMFVGQLISHYDAEMLIQAKFVEKWLGKQNWGGKTADGRLSRFHSYIANKPNRITSIIHDIQKSATGRAALQRAGLMTPEQRKQIDAESQAVGPEFEAVFLPIITPVNDENRPIARRSLEQSAEEQRLRHRHREAMVLNDGSRPFNHEDIF